MSYAEYGSFTIRSASVSYVCLGRALSEQSLSWCALGAFNFYLFDAMSDDVVLFTLMSFERRLVSLLLDSSTADARDLRRLGRQAS